MGIDSVLAKKLGSYIEYCNSFYWMDKRYH